MNIPSGISLTLDQLLALRGPARALKLSQRQRVRTTLAGQRHSALRGRGIDFDEVRIYQAGDDIRSMDWHVTARTDKPHVKLYHEERERPVFIMVDLSPSMFFGTRVAFKSVIAAQTAALLGWASIHNGDRLGAIVSYSADALVALPPKSRQHGILPLLKLLADQEQPQAQHNQAAPFSLALSRLRHIAKPGSLIFLISDFHTFADEAERHLSQLAKHTEIVAIPISDPIEITPPPPARYAISDGEQISQINTANKAFVNAYQQHFAQQQQYLSELCRMHHIPLMALSTADDVPRVLQRYLST